MATTSNKLFAASIRSNIVNNNMVSKVRRNREYLISENTAAELNTYVSFQPFPTFNDLFPAEYDGNGNEVTPDTKGSGTPGVRSIFNKAGAVVIGGQATTEDIISKKASDWRISNNVPLMDNRETRTAIKQNSGCSVKELVEASQEGLLGRETYSYSDFMYCKYLGRASNNYLITLRRFPYPVDDFIASIGVGEDRRNPDYTTKNADSIGCMVTWLNTPGNEMSNILKYSVAMPFKEMKAQIHQGGVDADAGGGPANAIAAAFDPTYRAQYQAGHAGGAIGQYMDKFFPWGKSDPPYPASQWNSHVDSSKVYGPVDTIKTTYMRDEGGLDFQQNISITFDYELRSYNGINGRQALMDLLANILNVTYSTGTFWGGGYRGGGAHQNNIFTNLNIFKARGGFTNFLDAFAEDYSNLRKSAGDYVQENGGLLKTITKVLNTVGGMLMSSMLNKMGRPQKALSNSLLSPAPVGFWHLTVGNPHHPIMSIGNMILKNTTINHYGPLGLDDFPTGIKVTCELTRGKSRDIRDIEKLYMHGNDRIYSPMGPKIFDMYEYSKEYKGEYKAKKVIFNNQEKTKDGKKKEKTTPDDTITIGDKDKSTSTAVITIKDIKKMQHVLQKYFGHADTNSIIIASMEQEMGAGKKKKKEKDNNNK